MCPRKAGTGSLRPLLLALVASALLAVPMSAQTPTGADLAFQAALAVSSKAGTVCSGFLVSDVAVLTAAHCTLPFTDIVYQTTKGEASLWARDPGYDLALLRLSRPACCPLPRSGAPRVGMIVVSVGAPAGLFPFLFGGFVSWVGLDSAGEDEEFGNVRHQVVLIQSLTLKGHSGSAWVNIQDGSLIGIHVRSLVTSDGERLGIVWAVGSDTVKEWLSKWRVVLP